MRKLTPFLILLFIFCFELFSIAAETEKFAVQMPNGNVTIVHYLKGSQETLEDVMRSFGYQNYPYFQVADADIPQDKKDRKYWKIQGRKVVIDTAKKQADLDAVAAKEAEKDAVFEKMKVSREEFEKVKK